MNQDTKDQIASVMLQHGTPKQKIEALAYCGISKKGKMNLLQHLLVKLAEECNEVAKEALKITIFGPGDYNPNDPNKTTNVERLLHELDDLHAILELMGSTGCPYTPNHKSILEKKVKVIKYLEYSIARGMTDENASYEMDACVNSTVC
jgi:hypothetical protein